MSIIGILFPAFNSRGDINGGSLAPGGSPHTIQTATETQILTDYASIPQEVTKSDLLKVNKQAATMAGQAYMTQKFSNLALQAAESAVQVQNIKEEHSGKMMELHRKSASGKSKHQRGVQRHQLSSQLTSEYYNEYSVQLHNSSNLIDKAFQ